MAFSSDELASIANAAFDYFIKSDAMDQSIQEKPLLRELQKRKKEFPGGKESIRVNVKGDRFTQLQGFSHDSTVSYQNPHGIKQASFPWREEHIGIKFSGTELKKGGITIDETNTGSKTSMKSNSEVVVITNLLEDKLQDMSAGYAEGMHSQLWDDGTADPLLIPGIRSFIVDDPKANIAVAGINQVSNPWWQNHSYLSALPVTDNTGPLVAATPSNAADGVLVQFLQGRMRQLTRYAGGAPTHVFAGSDFLDQMERELRAKGNFTMTGWSSKGKIDSAVAPMQFAGLDITYDPQLDTDGFEKRAYFLDLNNIKYMPMAGEEKVTHNPSRPEDKYVYYRALTTTASLICKMRRSSMVVSI